MKTYSKTHSNKKALQTHVSRIKKRGGICSISGMTVSYHFPDKKPLKGLSQKKSKLKYDTKARRIKAVKTKGNIITFKEQFYWKGDKYWQIGVTGFETSKDSVKIIGFGRDTNWYSSMDELLDAIDWDKMEAWHSED